MLTNYTLFESLWHEEVEFAKIVLKIAKLCTTFCNIQLWSWNAYFWFSFIISKGVEYFANFFAYSNWQCQGLSENVYQVIFWWKKCRTLFYFLRKKLAEYLQVCKFCNRFFPWSLGAFQKCITCYIWLSNFGNRVDKGISLCQQR